MGISERKQRQREQVRETILDAAWKIVQTLGWNSLSLRNIAEAIEYSTPVIYSHFASKDDILNEFYKKGFQLMLLHLGQAAEKASSPDDKLYSIGIGYWNFAFNNKAYYQVMFGVDVQCCYKEELLPAKMEMVNFLHKAVEEALSHNGNQHTDASLKRSTFWCILHGMVSINITSRILKEEGKTEKVLDDAIKAFINSLKVQQDL